jgi:4-hydroxybenzoate polyprenyltransferase
VLWTLGFDTLYAMSDRQDDLRIGVKSSALFFGKYVSIAIGFFFAGTIFLLGYLGVLTDLHVPFWISLAIASMVWIWQYIRLQQIDLPTSAYSQMFRQNVWIGFVLLIGMELGCLL